VGATARVVVEAAQRAVLPLIAAGAGTVLLPRPLAELARALGCLVVEPRPRLSKSVTLVHRRAHLTPAAERIVELARNSASTAR
jgi:DNA-binding transcriptional LysR family regulator